MTIETALYLDDLEEASPSRSDYFSEADDHLRLIKSVLKSTFPNVAAAYDIPAIAAAVPPIGTIVMYAFDTEPTGWVFCDGATHARSDGTGDITVPDLRDLYVVSTGLTNSINTLYGSNEKVAVSTTSSTHTHTGTALAGGEHTHGGGVTGSTTLTQGVYATSPGSAVLEGPQSHAHTIANSTTHTHTLAVDAGGAHAHNVTVDVRPASYALSFICKI